MLMHVIAHGGRKSLYRKLALGEKSLVTVTLGIEPVSVVFRFGSLMCAQMLMLADVDARDCSWGP